MQAKLIQIGNSQGIRIPKAIIRQYDFAENIEMEMRADELVIKKSKPVVRESWAAAFVDEKADESVVFVENKFDSEDWEWN